MEAKFSTVVKDIISFSRDVALERGNDFIGTEHLALAIIKQKNNIAYKVLIILGIDINILEQSLIEIVNSYDKKPIVKGSIPLTRKAEKALKATFLEAKALKSDIINSLHLLLSVSKDQENSISEVLTSNNITYEKLQDAANDTAIRNLFSTELDTLKAKKSPLSLIFDTSEFSNEEIKDIVVLLSELYSNIGGDYLKVTGMNQFERVIDLDLA